MNDILTKTYLAGAAIDANRLVKLSADNTVIEAVDAATQIAGVSLTAAASGARIDVQVMGIALVKCGATIARSLPVTAEADGKAAVAALTADVYCAGYLTETAADGDLRPLVLSPFFVAGA